MKRLVCLFVALMALSGCKTVEYQALSSGPEVVATFRSAIPIFYYLPFGVVNLLPLTIAFAALSIIIGWFVFADAELVVKKQIAFYKKINWRIAPISKKKEIKNTRIIGLFLLGIGVATIVYIRFFL